MLGNQTNQTQIAVLFCTSTYTSMGVPFDCTQKIMNRNIRFYVMFTNQTAPSGMTLQPQDSTVPKNPLMLMVKLGIDEALAKEFSPAGDVKFNLAIKDFPLIPLRAVQNYSEMGMMGSWYMLLIPMRTFIFIVQDILYEKEKKLRKGMMTMGLKSSAYWFSWFLTSLFFIFFTNTILVLAGDIF